MTKKTRAKMRRALLSLSLVLVMMLVAVGGTIAWLTDVTNNVVNTFSPSNIDIELKEHKYYPEKDNNEADKQLGEVGTTTADEVTEVSNYKMVPGTELPKDPFVRVKKGSESCYLFVKITKTENYDTYFDDLAIGTEWKVLQDATTNPLETVVYYVGTETTISAVDASTTEVVKTGILNSNKIKVEDDLTTAEMDRLYNTDGSVKTDALPKLTFTAYAVQSLNNSTDAATLWEQASANTAARDFTTGN